MVGQLRIVSPPVVDDAQGRLSRTDVATQLLLLLLLPENYRIGLMLLLLQLLQMLPELSSMIHRIRSVVHHVLVTMDRVEIGLVGRRRRRVVLMAINLQMTCDMNFNILLNYFWSNNLANYIYWNQVSLDDYFSLSCLLQESYTNGLATVSFLRYGNPDTKWRQTETNSMLSTLLLDKPIRLFQIYFL